MSGVMSPEKDHNSPPEHLRDFPSNLPPELYVGDSRPWVTKFKHRDDRPDLLRPQFAIEPDSSIDFSTVEAQRAIRYFDLTLVPESELFDEWDDLEVREQRMYRLALLRELFDDSYEDLEQRLNSSGIIAREAGFDPTDVPSDTTLWREIRNLDEDTIEELLAEQITP